MGFRVRGLGWAVLTCAPAFASPPWSQFSGDTTPCKVAPVILHWVVSPDSRKRIASVSASMKSPARVSGSGFRMKVQGSGFRFRVQRSDFRVQGSGLRVEGSGLRVQGSGFRVQGAGFRIQSSELQV